MATTSSGLMLSSGSLWKYCETDLRIEGRRVEPPPYSTFTIACPRTDSKLPL